MSALYSRLAAQGIKVAAPHELTSLGESGQAIIDAWVEAAVDTLIDPVLSINCLVNPEIILIGGRLPAAIVDQIANRLNQRIEMLESLRDDLDSCIGCGCLSLDRCRLYNPDDAAARLGHGPRYLLGNTSEEALSAETRRSRVR